MLRYKVGFGFLVVLTVLDVVWISILVGEQAGSRGGQTTDNHPSALSAASPRSVDSSPRGGSALPRGVPGQAERAEVVDHVDGDTLRVMPIGASSFLRTDVETTVRLLEIDTPESVDPSSPDECYAKRADEALRGLAPVGSVVWVAPDQELLDPYDRTLLYLWTKSGRFINLAMVRDGFARAVLYEPNDAYIPAMRRAEREARRAGRGLWGSCEYFGQPRGLAQLPATPASKSPRAQPGRDPRFDYCYQANDAGYGNYVTGRDPEYDWYDDADSDGVVCEF